MSDEEEYSSEEEMDEAQRAAEARRRLQAEEKKKRAEVDRKKAEVRKRLEETSLAKKAKKGFMTPERKKKLRLLLRKKAAEELKKEQERKAEERRRIISQRCGQKKNTDGANEADLVQICQAYQQKIEELEASKWDLEQEVEVKDAQINELNISVNDLRGKFIKPTLKKISKYENKFAKLQKKAAEFNFRNQLKQVKKKEFTLDDEDKDSGKPAWAPKHDEKKPASEKGEDGEAIDDAPPEDPGEEAPPASEEAPPASDDAPPEEVAVE
ncbi:troponin I-like isoform X2 [Amphibalanus amphitrite]|uniref:troponin I-like isoform X2 n=1 Tax=Amphibalanus amphitrite TaxID=1232801 RepID=UPI001C920767|nr:troponin I-like isoform X2 [Amphibalanus amphitrite]XP_043191057.1 troponin I-like isoform X2 [Amphibalanus amphitrite]